MNLSEVRRLIAELRLPAGHYALHGSGPLLAYGLLSEINDVDIVARGPAWQHALELAPAAKGTVDDVVRPRPGVEIYDGWLGDDGNELISESRLVAGLPCVSLEAVLRFKRRLDRPKDQDHILRIEEYLATRGELD